jgi:hypothetical protein
VLHGSNPVGLGGRQHLDRPIGPPARKRGLKPAHVTAQLVFGDHEQRRTEPAHQIRRIALFDEEMPVPRRQAVVD